MERNVACILCAPAASHSPAGSSAEQSSQLQAVRVCLRACPSKGPTCQSNQINVNVVGKSSEAIPWACPMSRTGLTEKRAGWRAIRVVNLQFGRGGRPDLHGLGPGIISISGSQFLHRLKKTNVLPPGWILQRPLSCSLPCGDLVGPRFTLQIFPYTFATSVPTPFHMQAGSSGRVHCACFLLMWWTCCSFA